MEYHMKYAHLRLILLMSFVILDVHISAASNISGDTVKHLTTRVL